MNARQLLSTALLALSLAGPALAAPQLTTPVSPPENPWFREKARLGKTLFWDEQLSSTGSVACGTCHRPEAGFADPRAQSEPEGHRYFGSDRTFFTDDDVISSSAQPMVAADETFLWRDFMGYGFLPTRRNAPSVLNAAYAERLFYDGRAEETFRDPVTGRVVSPAGATLESQALGPLLSPMEMGHIGRTATDVSDLIRDLNPLADAEQIPFPMDVWVEGRTYADLFAEVFGDPSVQPRHIAQALAAYMRMLVTTNLPIDQYLAGDASALTPEEIRGWDLFSGKAGCVDCHPAPLFADNQFHNLGVDPPFDDGGRWEVTGVQAERGAFRTPALRQVQDTAPYFHDGSARTLEEVVEFYDQGGRHPAPNLAPEMVPLGLTAQERADLVAFLGRPLSHPRVTAAQAPFDRPLLASETGRLPRQFGPSTPGAGGFRPEIVHVTPPRAGRSITVGIEGGSAGKMALLMAGRSAMPFGTQWGGATVLARPGAGSLVGLVTLQGSGPGQGYGSVRFDLGQLPGPLVGTPLVLQWYVLEDPITRSYSATRATWSRFGH